MAEAFGGNNRVLVINPYTPARTEFFAASDGSPAAVTSKDVGKPVRLNGQYVTLATTGEEIYGFIESVEVGTKNGYNYGGVLCDQGCETYATDEVGTLTVGDLVNAGTITAVGTAVASTGAKVKQALPNSVCGSAGLAIKASSSPLVKSTAAVTATVQGTSVTVSADDMPALSGTIAAGQFNAFAFFVDSAGDLTTVMGTEAATAADVVLPVDGTKAMIGYVLVGAKSDTAFTGGTTALDATGYTAVYINNPQPVLAVDKWQVMARYTTGSYAGGVLLRKV